MGHGQTQVEFEEIERVGFDDQITTIEPSEPSRFLFRLTGRVADPNGAEHWAEWFEEMMRISADDEDRMRLRLKRADGDKVILYVRASHHGEAMRYAKETIKWKLELDWPYNVTCHRVN